MVLFGVKGVNNQEPIIVQIATGSKHVIALDDKG